MNKNILQKIICDDRKIFEHENYQDPQKTIKPSDSQWFDEIFHFSYQFKHRNPENFPDTGLVCFEFRQKTSVKTINDQFIIVPENMCINIKTFFFSNFFEIMIFGHFVQILDFEKLTKKKKNFL